MGSHLLCASASAASTRGVAASERCVCSAVHSASLWCESAFLGPEWPFINSRSAAGIEAAGLAAAAAAARGSGREVAVQGCCEARRLALGREAMQEWPRVNLSPQCWLMERAAGHPRECIMQGGAGPSRRARSDLIECGIALKRAI